MLPLIAIAISLVPDLIRVLTEDKTGTIGTEIVNAVKAATGTSDPADAKQKVATDPTVAANLQALLVQIALSAAKAQNDQRDQQRQADLQDLKQRLADVESARTNVLALADAASPIAWVAPIVSFLVMIGFYVLLAIMIIRYADDETISKNQLINISIGALVAAFSTVVNFWLGSSKSSQDKDITHAAQTTEVLKEQTQQTNTLLKATTETVAAVRTPTPSPIGSGAVSDTASNFSPCMAIVFNEEGGFTSDPADPNGPANWGITLKELRDWRGPGQTVTGDDVKTLTKNDAQEIYRTTYWNPMQCSNLPNGIDLVLFDFSVNDGVRTSIKTLQAVIGANADGSIGPTTLSAAKAADPRTVIQEFSKRRMDYYRSLQEWDQRGTGWTNRTNAIMEAALKMVGAPPPAT